MTSLFDFLLELLLEWDDIPSYEGFAPHGAPEDYTRSTEAELSQQRERDYDDDSRNDRDSQRERDYFDRLEQERSDQMWPDRYGWDQYA